MVCVSSYRHGTGFLRARRLGASLAGTALALSLAATLPADAASWQPFFRLGPPPEYVPAPYIEQRAPRTAPSIRPSRDRAARRSKRMMQATKEDAAPTRMPEGPLTIAISLAEQELKIYDANGLFAESRISSGKPGHSTPRGVFSIIQKRKWHRSNLYANAPMPYMQRITWSGVALHAGVVPGYPASHGCVRLPHAFAAKLWRWTRMGARVVIAHGAPSPVDLDHALLPARLPDPASADAEATAKDAKKAEHALGLRLTLDDSDPPARSVRTADASDAIDGEPLPVEGDRDEFDAGDDAPDDAPATIGATAAASRDKAANAAPDTGMWSYWPSAAATALRPPPVGRGHIAMFVSRKDGRLYVRRDFQPWFDVPVSIKDADRALGTHVFTARMTGDNKRDLRWSAISINERAATQDLSARKGKKRGHAGAEAAVSPQSPTPTAREALDRVAMPDGVLAAITPLLGNGASLVVSDKGLGPETGKGTDFIVLAR